MPLPRTAAALLSLALLAPAALAQPAPSDADRAEARAILAEAVGLDTSVEGKKTPELAALLAARFKAAGFPAEDVHVVRLGDLASLVVRWRGSGAGGKPIALMAHMDVVPAHRADWEREPYKVTEEKGYLFGRGVIDNKGGVSTLTATFIQLRRAGFTPKRDLILVFTGDEETDGATARDLLKNHRDLVDAEFALNSDMGGGVLDEATGKPMGYMLQTAEKSYASFTLTATNPGGHSSAPRPDNAIFDLMEAIGRLRAYSFPVQWNDTTLSYMRLAGPVTPGPEGKAMAQFAAHPGDAKAAATLSASPAHVGLIRTTCTPTMLQAGHADNALPQRAVGTVNCRIFPGVTVASVQAELQKLAGEKVKVATLQPEYWSSDASPLRPDVMAAVKRAVHAGYPGAMIAPGMQAAASDGVFFRAESVPTYGVAEYFLKESDNFAHGLNERQPVASFNNGLMHWRILLWDLAGPGGG